MGLAVAPQGLVAHQVASPRPLDTSDKIEWKIKLPLIAPIVAKAVLVQVGLQVLLADRVIHAADPRFIRLQKPSTVWCGYRPSRRLWTRGGCADAVTERLAVLLSFSMPCKPSTHRCRRWNQTGCVNREDQSFSWWPVYVAFSQRLALALDDANDRGFVLEL